MALIWNNAEYWAFELFREVLAVPSSVAWVISHDLGDVSLWNKTIEIAQANGMAESIIEDIKHANKCYDICRQNRNQFLHVTLVGTATTDGSAIRLGRKKGPKMHGPLLQDDLPTIRQICEDIEIIKGYVAGLTMSLTFRRSAAPERTAELPSWPERPALPELVWKPLPPSQPKRRSPRQS